MHRVLAQALDHREGERGRLARPGVRGRQQIFALEGGWNGLLLNLGGQRVAGPDNRLHQPGAEAQSRECRAIGRF